MASCQASPQWLAIPKIARLRSWAKVITCSKTNRLGSGLPPRTEWHVLQSKNLWWVCTWAIVSKKMKIATHENKHLSSLSLDTHWVVTFEFCLLFFCPSWFFSYCGCDFDAKYVRTIITSPVALLFKKLSSSRTFHVMMQNDVAWCRLMCAWANPLVTVLCLLVVHNSGGTPLDSSSTTLKSSTVSTSSLGSRRQYLVSDV